MTYKDNDKEALRKAKNAERMRRWRAENPLSPHQRAKEAERSRQWRKANPEKYKEQQNAWYAKNRERILAQVRAKKRRTVMDDGSVSYGDRKTTQAVRPQRSLE
ncbi:hypothetical protein [Phyllobacterium sp. UNC302MFCol5.2]|uniref:hypothetical protein n=1 Tax=Phyllobacterium sp. UNC302MFCol5.2 TaxID=1449065 RepID=UPI000481AB0F|nr:hypothetical protein [Phyllobacterium sp. UNC302MFCol5.2]